MSMQKTASLVVHGWTIFAHPLFMAQIEVLARQVEVLKQMDPVGYVKKNAGTRLAAITKLAFDANPQDLMRATRIRRCSRWASSPCVAWRKAWRANWRPKAYTWHM